MANKLMTARDVVAQLRDGMTLGIGGWGPRRKPMALPRLIIKRDVKSLDDFRFEDFEIAGYEAHPHIAAPVAV